MKKLIAGVLVGGTLGYLYYKFIGCVSGTCAITSNPFISTLYGAVLGSLLLSLLPEKKQVAPNEKENKQD